MPDNRTNPDDQEQIGGSVNENATGAADDEVEDEDDLGDDDQEEKESEGVE